MALQSAEKAALALRLCAARHLDPECCSAEDSAGFVLVTAAYEQMQSAAGSARLFVTSSASIGPYLVAQAEHLKKLPRGTAGAIAVAQVLNAETLLRATAEKVRQDGTGDGPSSGDEAGAPCGCGILDLAAQVEARVRQLLEAEECLPSSGDPAIEYVTALTDDDSEFAPFCIGGNVSIKKLPRIVEMVLKSKPLKSRDLWHIAYTLHHELVCHAFQGASAAGRLPDAHPSCHWSEGWMDTLAFDLVKEWEEAPRHWLPIRGDDARGELWRVHNSRYVAPARLSLSDIQRRRLARDAYRTLATTLTAYQIAASPAEACDIVCRFSLAANAHREANCGRLKTLGTKLRQLLLSEARPEAGIAAASACLAFTIDRDLGKLEQAISAASS